MVTVTIADAELDIDAKGTRRKPPGALRRWWIHAAGIVANWRLHATVRRYELRIATLRDKLETAVSDAAVAERKFKAEIDALKAEKTALAELHVRVCAATRLVSIQSQRQIDLLKSPDEE